MKQADLNIPGLRRVQGRESNEEDLLGGSPKNTSHLQPPSQPRIHSNLQVDIQFEQVIIFTYIGLFGLVSPSALRHLRGHVIGVIGIYQQSLQGSSFNKSSFHCQDSVPNVSKSKVKTLIHISKEKCQMSKSNVKLQKSKVKFYTSNVLSQK